MENRQELILGSVVKEYVDSAVPVSSLLLAKKYNFNLSPATIRAEMLELESEKYLYQPHISAGRIPTDKGFRYFVDVLMPEGDLSIKEQKSLQVEIIKLKAQNKMLVRTAAKLLSVMSENFAVSGIINSEDFFKSGMQRLFSQPEFNNLDSICKIAKVIDYLDENIDELSKELKSKSEIKVYIGKENPINGADECGMIVSKCGFKNGEEGILAIIGPKRMKYSHNVSLIDYLKKLLGS
jgi:heat-inducible transcriptional repressor